MKPQTFSSLGLDVPIMVPETIDEYEGPKMANKPGAALASAINNEVYRGTLAVFRDAFCTEVEASMATLFPGDTTLKRKTKVGRQKKNSDGTTEDVLVFDESEAKYVGRVLATVGSKMTPPQDLKAEDYFKDLLAKVLALDEIDESTKSPKLDVDGAPLKLVRFDPTITERAERGPKTTPKVYLLAAGQIVAAGKADPWLAHFGVAYTPAAGADEAAQTAAKTQLIAKKIQELEEAERANVDLAAKFAI